MKRPNLTPADIEGESFAIIARELGERELDPEQAPVIQRVIHTTADFSYADSLYFSPGVIPLARRAIREGAVIVTDTQMAAAGINKGAAARFGCQVVCWMSDSGVAAEAKRRGVTRASVSMERAERLGENVIFAVGNAPTALLRLRALLDGGYRPRLIIAVPVGFVNVVTAKEQIMETDIPCIVSRGRKGGSNVAACIVNALLYGLDPGRGVEGPVAQADSASFFQNRACPYFPCHRGADQASFNCLFCYCPLYALGEGCGGSFTYTKTGRKDCTGCTFPHRRDAAERIRTRYPELAERAGIRPTPPAPEPVPADGTDPCAVLARWRRGIAPPDEAAARRARAQWDGIAKPLGGLGRLEQAVVRIAALTGDENVTLEKRAVAVLCADNGIVARGVTQTDPSVTALMADMVARHRSSVCLMAQSARADVFAADLGMLRRVEGVIDLHVGDGTADMTEGPAMTPAQALQALRNGAALARSLREGGYRILVTGEMGIGNTATASAVASVLLGLPVASVTGRGAGLSDAGLERKRAAIEGAIACNRPDPADAFDVLWKLGGFDLAGLAGLYIGAALCRTPVVIDGFPSSVAALLAARMVPGCQIAMLPSHCSAEPAARAVLAELGLEPLLLGELKLGEGTGGVCLLPLLDAALAVYHAAARFQEVGIPPYQPRGGETT